MRIVLDSNILLVSIGKSSPYRPIWQSFIEGKYELGLSQDILLEYEEILRTKSAPGAAELVLQILSESPDVDFKHIYYRWTMIAADQDDDKFFDVAVACGVDYLVTNDHHFDIIKSLPFPKINIISAEEFLEIIKST